MRTDSDPLARGLSLSHAPSCRTNAGAATLADGDIDSFPETAGVRELDTIGRLMDAFRSSVHALNRHREQLAAQVKARTAELQELVIEHRQARAEAEKASRAKSAFLLAMSHEIRTPLYGISAPHSCWQITPHLTPSAMICGRYRLW